MRCIALPFAEGALSLPCTAEDSTFIALLYLYRLMRGCWTMCREERSEAGTCTSTGMKACTEGWANFSRLNLSFVLGLPFEKRLR